MRPGTAVATLLLGLAGCLDGGSEGTAQTEPAPISTASSGRFALPTPSAGPPASLASVTVLSAGVTFFEPSLGITRDGTFAVCCTFFSGEGETTMVSRDGGVSWSKAHRQPLDSTDPMLAVDPVTDRIYELNMFAANCSNLAFSDDQGRTWTDRPLSCAVPSYEFVKLGAGPPGPEPNPLAGSQYPSVLYQCRNVNVPPFLVATLQSWCAVSYDGGMTWPVDRDVAIRGLNNPVSGFAVYTRDDCGGVTSWPVVSQQGVAVLPLGSCNAFQLGVSRDSGLTWELVAAPGGGGVRGLTPRAAFDDAGRLYVLWQNETQRMLLARSDDLGVTWHGPWDLSPVGARTHMFEALVAGAEGRLAAAFFASTAPPGNRSGDVPEDARWHLVVLTIEQAHGDAPAMAMVPGPHAIDPVQVGPICIGLTLGAACNRNHGEFITAAATSEGSVHVAFVDGCDVGCAADPAATGADSTGTAGHLARIDGWRLR